TKAVMRHFRNGGNIINTASVTAYQGSPQLLDYSSTKGASVAFTRSLSQALAVRKIRVNAVAPGPTWTPLITSTFPANDVARFGNWTFIGIWGLGFGAYVAAMQLRPDGRAPDQIRPIGFELNIAPHATGSVLVAMGNTRVICGVTIEEIVPRWMKDQGVPGGWLTAEYSMLPYSTTTRKPRDIAKGRLDGRSSEIQRLIGRSLRSVIDLEKLGPRTMWIDCDVL